ncbi:MAG: site-2 protease family protein [Acidobacteriota bacterium]|jgi:Zn-dependent protease/CBS domain-containing protein
MLHSFRIARLFGIEIRLDVSLLLIFFLILVSLALGVFPAWHPDWSTLMRWGIAAAASVLFFAAVLAHELSHALVGRATGIPIRKITLFVFGGMAHMEGEPRSWRAELVMAAVGPATSLALGALFLGIAALHGGVTALEAANVAKALAALPPSTTVLLWLGQVNIVLALFNLVPGFPLDGGRVLRAALWGFTGDRRRATLHASRLGQVFAWLLIGTGIAMFLGFRVPIFGRGGAQGLWLAFIGWFLNNAARVSYRQVLIHDALEGIPVLRVARTRFDTVAASSSVRELVEEHMMRSGQRGFPVISDDGFIGLVCMDDVRSVPRDDWDRTTVRDVMTPAADLTTIGPDDPAEEALERLARKNVRLLPVLQDGELRGLLRRDDVLRWLALQDAELGSGSAGG